MRQHAHISVCGINLQIKLAQATLQHDANSLPGGQRQVSAGEDASISEHSSRKLWHARVLFEGILRRRRQHLAHAHHVVAVIYHQLDGQRAGVSHKKLPHDPISLDILTRRQSAQLVYIRRSRSGSTTAHGVSPAAKASGRRHAIQFSIGRRTWRAVLLLAL